MSEPRSPGKRIDPDFLKFFGFDVLLATIVGFVSWIVTRDQISSFVISLVIGSILLLVELRFQLAKTKDDLVASIDFQKSTSGDPQLRDSLRRIVEGYTGTLARGDARFANKARSMVSDVANDLIRLNEGFIQIDEHEVYDYIIGLMKDVRVNVYAHNIVEGSDFWFRAPGKAYQEENIQAVRRGAKLTRVFTFDSRENIDLQMRNLIETQVENGIDVRICFAPALARDLLIDFVVFDEKYVTYWDLVPSNKKMRAGRLFANDTEVRRARALHERILKESEPADRVLATLTAPTVELRPKP